MVEMARQSMKALFVRIIMVVAVIAFGETAVAAMEGSAAATRGRPGLPAQSRAEAQARIEAYFNRVDANRDGVLTSEEYAQESGRRAEKRAARLKARGVDLSSRPSRRNNNGRYTNGRRLDRSDTNGDGKVTRAELVASALAKFDRKDANKDGVVTPEERQTKRSYRRNKA